MSTTPPADSADGVAVDVRDGATRACRPGRGPRRRGRRASSSSRIWARKTDWKSRSPSSSARPAPPDGHRVGHLEGLLDGVRHDRRGGLLAVPRALAAQPQAHLGQGGHLGADRAGPQGLAGGQRLGAGQRAGDAGGPRRRARRSSAPSGSRRAGRAAPASTPRTATSAGSSGGREHPRGPGHGRERGRRHGLGRARPESDDLIMPRRLRRRLGGRGRRRRGRRARGGFEVVGSA